MVSRSGPVDGAARRPSADLPNGIFVAAINRVGHEGAADGGLEFWGASFVSDPLGVVLRRGSHNQEEVILQECDMKRIEETRRNWPFWRDRRVDAYGDILKRW